mmetsp:Transcript_52537/g.52897  ORF Transcript_52537/g.52897 Transcript_52537/m.52897 type:complete len:82 (-) Transcript_52537:443-688(-)
MHHEKGSQMNSFHQNTREKHSCSLNLLNKSPPLSCDFITFETLLLKKPGDNFSNSLNLFPMLRSDESPDFTDSEFNDDSDS